MLSRTVNGGVLGFQGGLEVTTLLEEFFERAESGIIE